MRRGGPQQQEQRQTEHAREKQELYDEVYQLAFECYSRAPSWVYYFREVLGVRGIVRQYFPDPVAMAEFERSDIHNRIQQLLSQLREKDGVNVKRQQQVKVITVRMPKALHASLRREAHGLNTSVNKLCILKLMQTIEEEGLGAD